MVMTEMRRNAKERDHSMTFLNLSWITKLIVEAIYRLEIEMKS